ncbi:MULTISPECIES: DUF2848 domain-containing protein [Marinobacterium]|uniref:DUF2848 domain-containing protein n=2 Tax=Marinobacterium TaxID=48075 RepID=A0A1H6DG91_9GAMM|nr:MULTISPECIES: DUF2848 domain-containing protein [Marinobacterium]TCK03560.1 uncharacterized protein DUF2848 [Marinobacterium mangrovicola]SEG84191.1 Protein of unknown function [Marinobacterium lutimaris]
MILNLSVNGQATEFSIDNLAIAGWAGRDQEGVQHHIDELAELGVQPPSTTPLFYRVDPQQLTQADKVQVLGEGSSGEAEVLLIADANRRLFVSLASDHTDRELESYSVAFSKQICVKPLAKEAWPLEEVAPHWDQLRLGSEIEEQGARVEYQNGTLAELLDIPTLLERLPKELRDNQGILPNTAMLCGTVPAIGGIRMSPSFSGSLTDPVLNRSIRLDYSLETLPVAV